MAVSHDPRLHLYSLTDQYSSNLKFKRNPTLEACSQKIIGKVFYNNEKLIMNHIIKNKKCQIPMLSSNSTSNFLNKRRSLLNHNSRSTLINFIRMNKQNYFINCNRKFKTRMLLDFQNKNILFQNNVDCRTFSFNNLTAKCDPNFYSSNKNNTILNNNMKLHSSIFLNPKRSNLLLDERINGYKSNFYLNNNPFRNTINSSDFKNYINILKERIYKSQLNKLASIHNSYEILPDD